MSQRISQHRPPATPDVASAQRKSAGANGAALDMLSESLNTAPTVQRLTAMAPNRTGMPDRLKAGVEAMSGMSLDHVRVYRNSSRPAQLNAHAYAQGSDIHLASGQEQHLPHEAWHVVQQAQGRVGPTMEMKENVPINDDATLEREADVMGARALTAVAQAKAFAPAAPTTTSGPAVAQCLFIFQLNPENYKITNAVYYRTQGKKYMTGNAEMKHVTADTVKNQTYNNVVGITLDQMADRVLATANTYLHLPGLDLIDAHIEYDRKDDMDDEEDQLTAIQSNFIEFRNLYDQLDSHTNALVQKKDLFLQADGKTNKDAAAFHLQNQITATTDLLESFRDLMPLVNIVSTLQKRGKEPEANEFLSTGKVRGGINSNWKALWAFFDFAAIDQIASVESDDREGEIEEAIRDSLPWLSVAKIRGSTAREVHKNYEDVTMDDVANYLAALMIANHIKLATLSYPLKAAECDFATEGSVEAALQQHDSPVDKKWVAKYAIAHI